MGADLFHPISKIFGNRGSDPDRRAENRMGERKAPGMEEEPLWQVCGPLFRSIDPIAEYRRPKKFEVHPDLMSSSGLRFCKNKTQLLVKCRNLDFSDRLFS